MCPCAANVYRFFTTSRKAHRHAGQVKDVVSVWGGVAVLRTAPSVSGGRISADDGFFLDAKLVVFYALCHDISPGTYWRVSVVRCRFHRHSQERRAEKTVECGIDLGESSGKYPRSGIKIWRQGVGDIPHIGHILNG